MCFITFHGGYDDQVTSVHYICLFIVLVLLLLSFKCNARSFDGYLWSSLSGNDAKVLDVN